MFNVFKILMYSTYYKKILKNLVFFEITQNTKLLDQWFPTFF